jgi:hypothetical protein
MVHIRVLWIPQLRKICSPLSPQPWEENNRTSFYTHPNPFHVLVFEPDDRYFCNRHNLSLLEGTELEL